LRHRSLTILFLGDSSTRPPFLYSARNPYGIIEICLVSKYVMSTTLGKSDGIYSIVTKYYRVTPLIYCPVFTTPESGAGLLGKKTLGAFPTFLGLL
jgi:hypothetical protein